MPASWRSPKLIISSTPCTEVACIAFIRLSGVSHCSCKFEFSLNRAPRFPRSSRNRGPARTTFSRHTLRLGARSLSSSIPRETRKVGKDYLVIVVFHLNASALRGNYSCSDCNVKLSS